MIALYARVSTDDKDQEWGGVNGQTPLRWNRLMGRSVTIPEQCIRKGDMKSMRRVILLGGLAVSAVAAVACSSGGSEGGESLGASLPPNDQRTSDPVSPITEPGDTTSITIIDTLNPDECNFIHAINACFVDGAPPKDVPLGEVMDLYFDARDLVAEALVVEPTTAKIADIKRVEWPDASLGVPAPGFSYAQVITPGFKMVLEFEGKSYVFHTGSGRVVPEQPIQ